MASEKLEENLVQVHEHGFVKLVEVMGSDQEVENAARLSYGTGTRKVSQTRNLIRYLVRHKHTSPLEMCEVKFHLKLPIFVMRQLVRHRTASLNEYSGRYSIMSDEFYVPEPDYLQKQSSTNNQGREGSLSDKSGKLQYEFNRLHDNAHMTYQNLLDEDLTRELARGVLPVTNYTECVWKIDLHNFFHFCKLRMDSHAQREIQDFAKAMYELVKPKFPICCEAFEDYVVGSVTFTRSEMKFLREWVIGDFAQAVAWEDYLLDAYYEQNQEAPTLDESESRLCEEYGLSKRELSELKDKIGVK
jgi:thymidylate synthase (FAD)